MQKGEQDGNMPKVEDGMKSHPKSFVIIDRSGWSQRFLHDDKSEGLEAVTQKSSLVCLSLGHQDWLDYSEGVEKGSIYQLFFLVLKAGRKKLCCYNRLGYFCMDLLGIEAKFEANTRFFDRGEMEEFTVV